MIAKNTKENGIFFINHKTRVTENDQWHLERYFNMSEELKKNLCTQITLSRMV